MRAAALHRLNEGEPRAVATPIRILLVDDNEDLRSIIAERLRQDGIEVVEAGGGADAFAAVGEEMMETPARYFDLIISDLQMPEGGGFELLWALRFTDYLAPVVLLSGYVDETTRARARKLGAAAILLKPFDMDRLYGIVLGATTRPWWGAQ